MPADPAAASGAGDRAAGAGTTPRDAAPDVAAAPSGAAEPGVVASFVVPGYPHPLLIPERNPAYQRLRDAYDDVRRRIEALQPELLLLYSTQWLSVIGHQVQARPEPEWTHVDQEWHELGSIPYRFSMDPAFGAAYVDAGRARGLEMRTVDYHGFPIDTGAIVALKLLDPDDRVPASIVSCNMYADRAETVVLGKAARDAIEASDKRVVCIAVTALSNRVHTDKVPFEEDRIHSLKDDEWNRKYLEILAKGRLEDAAQLARTFSDQANGDQKMKAMWWLNAVNGQTNAFDGDVVAYEPLYGTGGAVVALTPTAKATEEAEFDEDDAEVHLGDRNVLGGANLFEAPEGVDLADQSAPLDEARRQEVVGGEEDGRNASTDGSGASGGGADASDDGRNAAADPSPAAGGGSGAIDAEAAGRTDTAGTAPTETSRTATATAGGVVQATQAPKPVGAYPHARRVGDLLYLSGLGPRDPASNEVPGGPVWDASGQKQDYDIRAQTDAVVRNMKLVLAASGATIDDVVDVTCYLIDMERDFAGFNEVYAKHFGDVQAARTTLEINRLPTPIAVEFKVVAEAPDVAE